MNYFAFAADTARQTFDRAVRNSELTHWQHPDYPSYGCCGTMTSRFSSTPTCPQCQVHKAQWDAEDDETAAKLGLR